MKKQIAKDLVFLSVVTLVTVCVWVSLQGYHRLNQEYLAKLKEEAADLKPIDPRLPVGVLNEIKKRREYSLEEVKNLVSQQKETASESGSGLSAEGQ